MGKERKNRRQLYRVSFHAKPESEPFEIVVESVTASDFMGLVSLNGLVFNDVTKQVILPQEDKARKRFGKVRRLHIPYHSIICIEEFEEAPLDVENLPYIRGIMGPDEPGEPLAD